MERLCVAGRWFVDEQGRRRLLRGVNLGADAKLPADPPGATHLPQDPASHRDVSFVGRPFDVADADAWFARLAGWGVDVVRFLVTWEAIEHAGPGEHDGAYLDHVRGCVEAAAGHGVQVVIDPHQDVWSRWSGGDGAPGWTLEAIGFDLASLGRSGAAIRDWERPPELVGVPMVWPNGLGRLASATMFSLFFAGSRVAPHVTLDGAPLDVALQGRFISAIRALAARLADLPNVLGYEALNEPSAGFLGLADLRAPLPVYGRAPRLSALDAMAVGSGIPVRAPIVDVMDGVPRVVGETVVNPHGVRAWRVGAEDPWRLGGVWDLARDGTPVARRPDHFADLPLWDAGMRPFLRRFAAAIREVDPRALLFVPTEPGGEVGLTWSRDAGDPDGIVAAPHWYDLATLVPKRWDPKVAWVWGRSGEVVHGREAVRRSYAAQIGALVEASAVFGEVPVIVGELGVPFDLVPVDPRQAPEEAATDALHAYADALDANLVHATWWNVTPDNTAEHGDGWNSEDLSLVTRDGTAPGELARSRALDGWSRPRLLAAAGDPISARYDPETATFELVLDADASAGRAPTRVSVPRQARGDDGPAVEVTGGTWTWDAERGIVEWHHDVGGRHRLVVRRRG